MIIFETIFAGITKGIRYGAMKLMKRLRRPDDERPVIAAADYFNEAAMGFAFKIFRDKKFESLAGFQKLAITEKDRIFNELVVGAISLILFSLDSADDLAVPEDFHFWRMVRGKIVPIFKQSLLGFGVDNKNGNLYTDLINMRFEEYQKLSGKIFKEWENNQEFRKLPNTSIKRSMATVFAATLGMSDHITRGKIKPGNTLLNFLKKRFIRFHEWSGKFIMKL